MNSLKVYLLLLVCLIKIFGCEEIDEKKLFRISTVPSTYVQYDLKKNVNGYNYIFIQIILCQEIFTGSYIEIYNEMKNITYSTDIVASGNYYIDISDQTGSSFTLNATSNDIYIQYQYINTPSEFYSSGRIQNYDFDDNSITFDMSPVIDNSETTYDLYYLGKINIYNEICQKVAFILGNDPISSKTIKDSKFFNLKFDNFNNKKGYYLIKGRNVDDVDYFYFYETIHVVNRLGTNETHETEFFEVQEESEDNYHIYTTPGNLKKNKYLNIQIILCEDFGKQKSHFEIFNENNEEIFFSDVLTSRQAFIDVSNAQNITIMATSPHMYIQYQFTDNSFIIIPRGAIYSYDSNIENTYLNFNITTIEYNTSIDYELFYGEKKKLASNNTCELLVYSLNNKPLSTVRAVGDTSVVLKFNYDLLEGIENEDGYETGYVFIKAKNLNDTNYTYFYSMIETNIACKSNDDNLMLFVLLYIVFGLCIIAIIIVIVILYKAKCCKRNVHAEEEPGTISLVNRPSE